MSLSRPKQWRAIEAKAAVLSKPNEASVENREALEGEEPNISRRRKALTKLFSRVIFVAAVCVADEEDDLGDFDLFLVPILE